MSEHKLAVKTHCCPEVSEFIQKILFKNGYSWSGGRTPSYLNKEAIAIPYSKKDYLTYSDLNYLNNNGYKILSLDEFIDQFMEKPIILGGYTAKFSNGEAIIGCVKVDLDTAREIVRRMESSK